MAKPEAVPYLVLGDSRRGRLQERLRALVDSWYRTWAAPTAAEPLAELVVDGSSRDATVRGDAWIFEASRGREVLLKATVPVDFLRLLNGVGQATGIGGIFANAVDTSHGAFTAQLTEDVVAALCADIAQTAFPGVRCTVQRLGQTQGVIAVPLSGAGRRGSGAQTLVVSSMTDKPRSVLELLLAPAVVEALLAGRPALANKETLSGRRKASHEQLVKVSAVLGNATVSWRDLRSLCVGDVIVLEQSLSAPCALQVGDSPPFADAQLGQQGNALAAQITRLRPASQ
jgi:hypothetical protein